MDIKIIPRKLKGSIDALPSKSHAHRVLIAQKLAQLQSGENHTKHTVPSFSADIDATKNCLAQLNKEKPFLDCKESGSTLRFMLPAAMALKDEAVFIGSGKLPYRPVSPLKEEMETHGCHFTMGDRSRDMHDRYKEICTVTGRLRPGRYRLAGNISSQFVTGLLLALPILDGDSTLELTTELESAGYVDLTMDVLRDFNIKIKERKSSEGFIIYEIKGNQQYKEPENLKIQGDWSNAAFWLACGALGGDITVRGLDTESSQRDKEFLDILKAMGASVSVSTDGKYGSAVRCTAESLSAVNVSAAQIPDLVPALAAVMAFSRGSSMITEAQRLRIKESDRIATVFDFLSRLGADITDGGSGLSVTGKESLEGGTVSGHNDHRIVMSAAAASCGCRNPVTILGADAVNKSYPGFFEDFAALGGKIYEV